VADEIFALLQNAGSATYYGEDVTQLEHALQCAKLASDAHSDEETIMAALLHDIGHICAPQAAHMENDIGVVDHEGIGADFLRARGFAEKVAQLVQSHVDAKRYLTATNPAYAARLSPASVETLKHQGGPMTEAEAAAFAHDPLFREKLRMRQWDEQGKVPGWGVPPLDSYRAMVERHLAR
jgi:phosphonate degradation associated HDIG domain protein